MRASQLGQYARLPEQTGKGNTMRAGTAAFLGAASAIVGAVIGATATLFAGAVGAAGSVSATAWSVGTSTYAAFVVVEDELWRRHRYLAARYKFGVPSDGIAGAATTDARWANARACLRNAQLRGCEIPEVIVGNRNQLLTEVRVVESDLRALALMEIEHWQRWRDASEAWNARIRSIKGRQQRTISDTEARELASMLIDVQEALEVGVDNALESLSLESDSAVSDLEVPRTSGQVRAP